MLVTLGTQRVIDCKTVGFFLKISKEIGKAWRKCLTRARRASLTFSLVPDLLFDFSRVLDLEYELFCSLKGLRPWPNVELFIRSSDLIQQH